jgi:hypothetical protein
MGVRHGSTRRSSAGSAGRATPFLVTLFLVTSGLGVSASPATAQQAAAAAPGPRRWDPGVRAVPPPPAPPVSRTRMNCVGCAIAGGIVLGAGGAHALVGAIELSDPAPGEEDRGHVLLALAGLHGLVGIPLLVAGLWPVETTGARAADLRLEIGPARSALQLSF